MGSSKDNFELFEIIKIRFPPFESSLRTSNKLPMGVIRRCLINSSKYSDIEAISESCYPEVKMGSEESWLIERKYVCENNSEKVTDNLSFGSGFIETQKPPELVELQRMGWYLTPHSLHLLSRKMIPFSVILLLFSIIIHVFEPVLISFNLFPVTLDSSIKLGLLDYPMLLVIVSPLVIAPLIMRIIGNILDLGKQRVFLSKLHKDPIINLTSDITSDRNLVGNIDDVKDLEFVDSLTIWWQVGLLPPSREKILESLNSSKHGQPPPGFSTPLPHYWSKGLSDGTDVGESTPPQSHDAPGGIFLPPLRIHAKGSMVNLEKNGGKFSLKPPAGNWPGTQNGGLIRVHWELVVKINRINKSPLYWVSPLKVKHGKGPFVIKDLPVQDGRLELTLD